MISKGVPLLAVLIAFQAGDEVFRATHKSTEFLNVITALDFLDFCWAYFNLRT